MLLGAEITRIRSLLKKFHKGDREVVEGRETRSDGGVANDENNNDLRYADQIANNLANANAPIKSYFDSNHVYNPDTYMVRFGKKRMGSMMMRRARGEDRLSQVRL